MDRILFLAVGYCFGLIQTAFIVGKLMGKIDIREHGSKSAGSTNVKRVLGWKAALIVFFLDILKAVAACVCCSIIYQGASFPLSTVPVLFAGLGVILGHDFPVYLRFKGGKGIASTVGVLLCVNPVLCWIAFAATVGVIALSRYVSVGSLVLNLLFIAIVLITSANVETIIVSLVIAAIAVYQHKANIVRLIHGTESKFSLK